jgi:hypothetical protein
MSPGEAVGLCVATTIGAALMDFLMWERMSFFRNMAGHRKVPLFYRPAIELQVGQTIRWIVVGALLTTCNVSLRSRYYEVIVIVTVVFVAVHLLLSMRRYRSAFAAANQSEPS